MPTRPRLLAALLAAAFVLPAAAFEGRVHFDMTTGRNTQPMVYAIDGPRARFELPQAGSTGAASIMDFEKQEMMVLMPEQKMYMTMSLQDGGGAKKGVIGRNEVELEDTGETETILGRETRKYRVKDRQGTTEIWAAEGMGTFMGQMGGGNPMKGGSLPQWQQQLTERGFFPLRVVALDRRGRETLRMQATKIEEESLPDSLFSVPEGFQRFDMGGMFRGLIPGMK